MSEEQIQQKQEHNCLCKKTSLLIIISLILSIASLTTSIYTLTRVPVEKKVVISTQYDKGKSLEKALKTKKPVIVFFYTDWCGFCQRFVPTYHKISKNREIKKNFAVAYVNCEDMNNRSLMEEYNVRAFPTVYVVDKAGNKTQLENQVFFNQDSVEILTKKALELINETK